MVRTEPSAVPAHHGIHLPQPQNLAAQAVSNAEFTPRPSNSPPAAGFAAKKYDFVETGIGYFKKFRYLCLANGGLAQLARALAWHARGHRFDSDILHQDGTDSLLKVVCFIWSMHAQGTSVPPFSREQAAPANSEGRSAGYGRTESDAKDRIDGGRMSDSKNERSVRFA